MLAPLAACATPAVAPDPLAGLVAGEPANCISLNRNTSPEVVDERTILYRETARRVWRTGPVGNCPGLRPITTLIVRVQGAQLCRDDPFQVVAPQQIIASGICRFDRFTPYERPRR
ncbi:hypothetical protein CKY28_11940 [Sphingomonas lenta]|uniref:Uncharacterized protein n=1 Tax=Sphingomonas lenta TaxID=1141887 RepID=A0A2A2SGR4_9SPHN|nr:hypothetical protein CKY28_11940 [Sphingomonas lenta]